MTINRKSIRIRTQSTTGQYAILSLAKYHKINYTPISGNIIAKLKKKTLLLEDIVPFSGTTDTSVLDFW